MRYFWVVLILCISAWAGTVTIQVLSSNDNVNSYDIPARGMCIPGTYGPLCGVRGGQTAYTHTIRVKAIVNDAPAWLTCQIVKKKDLKHCGQLTQGNYTAEPKGKDQIIVYGWANPLYRGDMKKADKYIFRIGAREP